MRTAQYDSTACSRLDMDHTGPATPAKGQEADRGRRKCDVGRSPEPEHQRLVAIAGMHDCSFVQLPSRKLGERGRKVAEASGYRWNRRVGRAAAPHCTT